MCLCATWLETPFGRVQPVGYLQALPKSWPWDSREKNTARDALTQPPPPFLPQRLRAVSYLLQSYQSSRFLSLRARWQSELDGSKMKGELQSVYSPSSPPPPHNKPIERALEFWLLSLLLFSRSTSTKWQRCVVYWRASSSQRKAVQTGIWTRTSCIRSSVPHSSSHSCGVSVVIWSSLPWMHLIHLPGTCSQTHTMLRWISYYSNYKVLSVVCLFAFFASPLK